MTHSRLNQILRYSQSSVNAPENIKNYLDQTRLDMNNLITALVNLKAKEHEESRQERVRLFLRTRFNG